MITVGVDLAAGATNTAVARVEWTNRQAVITEVIVGADDDAIITLSAGADRIGIDCALGWPDAFVAFVARHRDGLDTADVDDGAGWRSPLTNRATDLACVVRTRDRLGRAVRPLSVSADLLGHVAMRCSVLLSRLAHAGVEIDRSGMSGRVAEVYPAACLALWGITLKGYKGTARRAQLSAGVDALVEHTPWLRWAEHAQDRCRRSDHAFDAVVAALGARAAGVHAVTVPPDDQLDTARREGWIALPTGPLADLP